MGLYIPREIVRGKHPRAPPRKRDFTGERQLGEIEKLTVLYEEAFDFRLEGLRETESRLDRSILRFSRRAEPEHDPPALLVSLCDVGDHDAGFDPSMENDRARSAKVRSRASMRPFTVSAPKRPSAPFCPASSPVSSASPSSAVLMA